MERITSLINQLYDAHRRGAAAADLLALTRQLQAALQQQMAGQGVPASTRVAVELPAVTVAALHPMPEATAAAGPVAAPGATAAQPPQPKIVEVLQVDENELEAELEEIRRKAEFANKLQAKQNQMKPGILFEFDEDAETPPTLLHQPNYQPQRAAEKVPSPAESPSLNERLKEDKVELAHRLSEAPIKDLKKAIGINDRYVFINELFRGDEAMYERSIKTINNFSIYAEAQYWIERELKIKLGWDDERPATQEFYALVKRRFS
ncbi:MAG: hypothetical protein ACK4E8_11100 [Lacibacter sp.]